MAPSSAHILGDRAPSEPARLHLATPRPCEQPLSRPPVRAQERDGAKPTAHSPRPPPQRILPPRGRLHCSGLGTVPARHATRCSKDGGARRWSSSRGGARRWHVRPWVVGGVASTSTRVAARRALSPRLDRPRLPTCVCRPPPECVSVLACVRACPRPRTCTCSSQMHLRLARLLCTLTVSMCALTISMCTLPVAVCTYG